MFLCRSLIICGYRIASIYIVFLFALFTGVDFSVAYHVLWCNVMETKGSQTDE